MIRKAAELRVRDNHGHFSLLLFLPERERTLQKSKDNRLQFWDTKWKSGTLGGNSGTPPPASQLKKKKIGAMVT